MISTAQPGGMRSVVEGYRADGFFERWNVVLLNSHAEGGRPRRLAAALSALLRLALLLFSRRAGLVHCHAAMRRSFWRKSLFSLLARSAGVPVLFHLHGSSMKEFVAEQPPLLKRLIRWVLEKQSVVVVLSQGWFDFVRTIAPGARLATVPNCVELPVLEQTAAGADGQLQLLFLGAVGERKGVFDLLPAFKEALARVPSLRLVVGGSGAVERARALAAELGIEEHVEFPGWVDGESKRDLLRRGGIFVLPSHNENLPVSLLEAMSWRMPVISTRVGGIPEMVRDGVDGILIGAGDRASLACAIVELAQDAGLRERMGGAARERVAGTFQRDVVMPQLEAIYRSLSGGTAGLQGSEGRST